MVPLAVLGVSFVALSLPQAALLYKRRRHLHLVLCPDTDADALVRLDDDAAPKGARKCPVKECTQWPRERNCSQGCSYGLRSK
jgi:hypothetical protein